MKHEIPPCPRPDIHDEEDAFLRPEHDPDSFVNRLAQASQIISAPSFTVYADSEGIIIAFRAETT